MVAITGNIISLVILDNRNSNGKAYLQPTIQLLQKKALQATGKIEQSATK